MALLAVGTLSMSGAEEKPTVQELSRKLWPQARIEAAIQAIDQQKAAGLLSDTAYSKRRKMLEERRAGSYRPEALSAVDPPLNFIQNGGFEQINPNSAKNRSRWLWWGGWSWGGDYENMWEDRAGFVHSGKYSARIRCVGAPGRIGISTPPLPAVPGVQEYRLTFWARGEGGNTLFVNFEEGASGALREKMPEEWKQITVVGKPVAGKNTYQVYFYAIGGGTIWLDDAELVPVGGNLEE